MATAAQAVLAQLTPVPAARAALALRRLDGNLERLALGYEGLGAHERLGNRHTVHTGSLKDRKGLCGQLDECASSLGGLLGDNALGTCVLEGLGECGANLVQSCVGTQQRLVLIGGKRSLGEAWAPKADGHRFFRVRIEVPGEAGGE